MRGAAPILLALALAGCAREATAPPPEAHGPAAAVGEAYQPVAVTSDWNREVRLVEVTHAEWLRELEALRGRIVVVDHWATWCAPCVERFPAMVAMSRRYGSQGVTFVTLSLDDRDDPETGEKVIGFLREQDARMPNYLMDEIIPDAFEKLDLLGIPAVFIYDENGALVRRLTGDDPNAQFSDVDVDAAVREMIAARS